MSPLWLLLFLTSLPGSSTQFLKSQQWTKNIKASYSLQSFDRETAKTWTKQQGVRFITPDLLAIYQVFRTENQPDLQPGDLTGGGGSFRLRIVFLNISEGREVKRIELATGGELSEVIPAAPGKFLIRTGDVLYLYSDNFERLASKSLPRSGNARYEWWDVKASPSGKKVFLAHQQTYGYSEGSRSELQILSGDTLEHLQTISVPRTVSWSAADTFLIWMNPKGGDDEGTLDFEGKWTRVSPESPQCTHSDWLSALAKDRFAEIACHQTLWVRTLQGTATQIKKLKGREAFLSIISGDDILAAEVNREAHDFFDTGKLWNPARVELYDLKNNHELFSITIKHRGLRYTVSPASDVAVVDGEDLTVYGNSR